MTTWTERSATAINTPLFPKDNGNGRFQLSPKDSGLRFNDTGSGRVEIASTGLYVGKEGSSGRFTIVLLSSFIWTERTT